MGRNTIVLLDFDHRRPSYAIRLLANIPVNTNKKIQYDIFYDIYNIFLTVDGHKYNYILSCNDHRVVCVIKHYCTMTITILENEFDMFLLP